MGRLIAGADAALLQPPVNVLRLSLHPQGLAPRIANLAEWRAHLLARLRRQIEVSADPVLADLLEGILDYPAGRRASPVDLAGEADTVAVHFGWQRRAPSPAARIATTSRGAPLRVVCSMMMNTRLAQAARSIAPPMPPPFCPAIFQLAKSPLQATS